jgi:phosphate transport system substrate-binding protein
VYALANNMSFGLVQNAAGTFVKASLVSTTEAAASLKEMPEDFRVSITNPPGKGAYPICSFTWLLVPAEWADAGKEKTFVGFLNWMVDEKKGQSMTKDLSYAPLPASVAKKVKARIAEIKVKDGKQAKK